MPFLLRRCAVFFLFLAGLLAARPAQAQRRPVKRIPGAASPSADTTSGGASATPKKAPRPAIAPGTYRVRGLNSHHLAEAAFKAVARALRMAVEPDPRAGDAIPSTKGAL